MKSLKFVVLLLISISFLNKIDAMLPLIRNIMPFQDVVAANRNLRYLPVPANALLAAAVAPGAPLDVMAWDNATFAEITGDTFNVNAFGTVAHPIPNNNVIANMQNLFNGGRASHIALARVVILRNDGQRFVYPIPHVFVSGSNSGRSIQVWRTRATAAVNPALRTATRLPLPPGGGGGGRPIDEIVRGIGNYGFSATSLRNYGHSERAAILCLLYSNTYSLEDIIGNYNANDAVAGTAISQIVIQIKVAHDYGQCSNCSDFLSNNARVTTAIPGNRQPNIFAALNRVDRNSDSLPFINFRGRGVNHILNVRAYLRSKSGFAPGPAAIPIFLRISNNNNHFHAFDY